MTLELIAFSDRGMELARRLAGGLGGTASRGGRDLPLSQWTGRAFRQAQGLVFVGSVGIAVRAIAPYVRDKSEDPAVVVVDEQGRYAIPVLSGHLGGANDLARRIAQLCGAQSVITTATDLNGLFAVDSWARHQNCALSDPKRVKDISGRLLAGGQVSFRSDRPILGDPPQGVVRAEGEECDFCLTVYRQETDALFLIPRIAVLGLGCRKGTSQEAIEGAFSALLERTGLWEQAFCQVCSIDLKREEPGILAFCRDRGIPFTTYPAGALAQAEGEFFSSERVARITGVDNVCERSAVLGSGGALIQRRTAGDGITMAVALRPFTPDWRWQYG